MVNFTSCTARFLNDPSLLAQYTYHGTPRNADAGGAHHLMSLAGCQELCGAGPEIYPWSRSAGTILTWVLPMVIMFLMAPFESNQVRNSLVAAVRWIGSPFISMWYILCDISVTGKCAAMVDLSVAYNELPLDGSDFSDFRDVMVALSGMNQFLLNRTLLRDEPKDTAQLVLRVALFGDLVDPTDGVSTRMKRAELAASIRTKRRRGVVPVLLGLMWFLFILGLSINDSEFCTAASLHA